MTPKKPRNRLLTAIERPYVRPALLFLVAGMIIFQIVVLSPAPLEEGAEPLRELDPQSLLVEDQRPLAVGIPAGKIPDYNVEKFEYVSTFRGEKQWKLQAEKAYMYNHEKIVHAIHVKAFLFDPKGDMTVVTGLEAKFIMKERELELFGRVNTVFPDGFTIQSEYLQYLPGKKLLQVPNTYRVLGAGKLARTAGSRNLVAGDTSESQKMSFQSQGLKWEMAAKDKKSPEILLPQAVRFVFDNEKSKEGPTTIVADQCRILKNDQTAKFTMWSSRPVARRFVEIFQEELYSKARRAELNYGDASPASIEYLTLYEDVLLRELSKDKLLKYATGGKAGFESDRNRIILSEFPQVYQDHDTVTGDVIVLNRDTDVVEVQNSNAFTQGREEKK